MTPQQAAAALQAKNLVLAPDQKVAPSDDAQKGLVVDQSPSPNTSVDQKTAGDDHHRPGADEGDRAQCHGMDSEQARSTIQNANLKYQ